MSVSESPTLQIRRPLYAALLKMDELVLPLEADRRSAQQQSAEESAPVIKEIDLALRAIRAETAGEHALAVLALVQEGYDNEVTEYLTIAHLRERYLGDRQVQVVTSEFLDRPSHRKLRSWFHAAEARTPSATLRNR
jgi:hypothetical protein